MRAIYACGNLGTTEMQVAATSFYPHSCDDCDRSFTQKAVLQKHREEDHGCVRCHHCGDAVAAGGWAAHMGKAHAADPTVPAGVADNHCSACGVSIDPGHTSCMPCHLRRALTFRRGRR